MRSTSLAPALASCLILAAACGSGTDAGPITGTTDQVPITQEAIVAVLLDHLPADPIELSGSARSAQLTYRVELTATTSGSEEEVDVSISGDTRDPCAGKRDWLTGCEVTTVEDGELTVYWQKEEPEEDPGILTLVMVREDDSVTLEYRGALIERDPREQEFVSFTFDDMVAAVTDPRLGLTTTVAADVPITQRAIAAVALEHVSTDTTSREASYTDDTSPKGALGADLHYGGDGESDGDLLRVFLTPHEEFSCGDEEYSDGCEEREVDGGRLFLVWTEEEPEEDPGYVDVLLVRDNGESVHVGWSGDTIVRNPRTQQNLEISVEELEAVAQDPRLSLTTTQDVVDLGAALDDWEGGEPDPTAHDRVPATDRSLLNAYLSFHGGYSSYSGFDTSPLQAEWGEGAVGGRMVFQGFGYTPTATIDVLAAPAGPAWLRDGDPCASYPGECVDEGRGRFLAWTPGPDGEVWHLAVRSDDVVGVRYGFDVPSRQGQVDIATEWSMINKDFVLDDNVGIETDKEMLDWDSGL